jgi:hypothetical protein
MIQLSQSFHFELRLLCHILTRAKLFIVMSVRAAFFSMQTFDRDYGTFSFAETWDRDAGADVLYGGTLGYMAPELLNGDEKACPFSSDSP